MFLLNVEANNFYTKIKQFTIQNVPIKLNNFLFAIVIVSIYNTKCSY